MLNTAIEYTYMPRADFETFQTFLKGQGVSCTKTTTQDISEVYNCILNKVSYDNLPLLTLDIGSQVPSNTT